MFRELPKGTLKLRLIIMALNQIVSIQEVEGAPGLRIGELSNGNLIVWGLGMFETLDMTYGLTTAQNLVILHRLQQRIRAVAEDFGITPPSQPVATVAAP